ncbi:MAG: hypothetical protein M3R36_09040 [Bacteroidota bacterium]|nr:hypothetical protein [Bacteroidota bacterium]
MKYIFLILIFSATCSAQFIHKPEDYNLGKFDPKNFNGENRKDNNNFVTVAVTPNVSPNPISNFITDIILNGDTVWFATGSGVMRTVDDFNTFQNYFGVAPFGEDDIAGFNLNKNVIVASTAVSQEISGETLPVGTGIKISTDYGLNWTAYPQPIDGRGDSLITYGSNSLYALPVVVPQNNLSYDIAVTKTQNDPNNYTIWICSFAGGLRKSTDYGNSWLRVLLPPDNLDSINVNVTGYNFVLNPVANLNQRVFSITAVNDSTLYVGTAGGINKTSDWGVNWRKYNFINTGSGDGISGNFVVSMEVQKFNGKEVVWGATNIAGDDGDFNAFSYSSDGGNNWVNTLENIRTNGISFKDSIIYGFTNEGLWRAEYGTFNWSRAGTIYDESTKDRLATNLFYSGNHIGDTLYIGSADGMLRTIDYGQPWIGKWKIYHAITPINLSSDFKTYAAPNPFSPDDEVTRIFYQSSTSSTKITITIYDFAMNPVRTLLQNAARTGEDVLFTAWDGKNNNGAQAANGVYFYRVEFDDEDPVWGKILLLQ